MIGKTVNRTCRTALIACDVFGAELAKFGPVVSAAFSRVEMLPMGLHDDPEVLRKRLQRLVGQIEADASIETVVLLYGFCGGGTLGLAPRRVRLVLPRADDCLGIIMGGHERHRAFVRTHPGSYFYSPGWIRDRRVPGPDRADWLRKQYQDRYDEEMIEEFIGADAESFEHCNCAAYLDLVGDAEACAYCHHCAAHLGWEFRKPAPDEAYFRQILAGPWENDPRFLIVRPGESVARDSHAAVVAQ
jgi:hypothetical protein